MVSWDVFFVIVILQYGRMFVLYVSLSCLYHFSYQCFTLSATTFQVIAGMSRLLASGIVQDVVVELSPQFWSSYGISRWVIIVVSVEV